MTALAQTKAGLSVLVVLALLMSGCGGSYGEKAKTGAAVGAVGGGLLGYAVGGETAGVLGGALLGGLIGGAVGDRLDQKDQELAARQTRDALEYERTGATTVWRNPDTGHEGSVTPTGTYQTAEGTYCREFEQTVQIGSDKQQAHGSACRQPDGIWRIVN